MKKIFLCSVLAIIVATVFSSCTKEGPQGPAGETGAIGPAGRDGVKGDKGEKGDTGAQGNMSISIHNTTINEWESSAYTPGSFTGKVNTLNEIITEKIISGGAVLVYQVQNDILKALPYSQIMERGNPFAEDGAADYTLTAAYDVAPGELSVYLQYSTSKIKTVASKTFRLIVIPGASGKRVLFRSGNSYSIEQLRSMDYEEVCAILGIRP